MDRIKFVYIILAGAQLRWFGSGSVLVKLEPDPTGKMTDPNSKFGFIF